MRTLNLPLTDGVLQSLRAGEMVLLRGTVAAARDAAHRRMVDSGDVPFDPSVTPVFYTGPTPAPPGLSCGACGPTTSSRMEPFIPEMLRFGMKTAIGKGDMGETTRKLFLEHRAVYLAAPGGAGALSATRIVSRRVVAWPELGPEAVSLLELRDFPVFVAWDLQGDSIYKHIRSGS